MPDSNTKVVSYYDVLLRESDVELLRGKYWLNDQCIAFYLEYLRHEGPLQGVPESLLIVGPEPSYLLTTAGSDVAHIVLGPLKFEQKEITLFAMNDNEDVECPNGGSHWSLAAYHRRTNTIHHYDSMSGKNSLVSGKLAAALKCYAPNIPKIIHEDCPQQQNGYDCGVYILAVAEMLCQRFAEYITSTNDSKTGTDSATSEKCIMNFEIGSEDQYLSSPLIMADFRSKILSLIYQMSERYRDLSIQNFVS